MNGWLALENLNVTNNQLIGHIPIELGELTNLKSINLSFNNFDGSIPVKLLRIKELKTLYLHENKLSGTIPDYFCHEDKPMKILIYGNLFCPPYPECIKYIGKQLCED